ncbi:MAG: tRNA preQ1(34) S-adenosylmethionine ribosyltransferase-isomerase QueA [Gemmatimonadota bacterium]
MTERRWTAGDFDYKLPPELIAQVPSERRGDSRLLVVNRDMGHGTWDVHDDSSTSHVPRPTSLSDRTFSDLMGIIRPTDLLVVNSTRVRHARLLGTRPSGAPAEVLLIHPSTDDSWIAIGSPGRAMLPGKQIALGHGVAIETIAVLDDGMRQVKFVGATASEAMARFGQLPLPPYIERQPTADDDVRYQTVYADREGSVAAPTAGLHFTDAMLDALRARGVTVATLDLEVGPGTFRPMDDGDVAAHPMHSEHFEIPVALADEIAACRARGAKVWAVGTTVVRALESAARNDGSVAAGAADTQLLIAPGFRFRVVDHLITNFHLPRSTLLMLVAAFAGYDTMMAAYRHAVEQRYRFYSYGDAMVIV